MQPRYDGKRYYNPVPTTLSSGRYGRMLRHWLLGRERRVPAPPLVPFRADVTKLNQPVPADALRATWLGHSAGAAGSGRPPPAHRPGMAGAQLAGELPGAEAVLSQPVAAGRGAAARCHSDSHDHFDHLDPLAIRALAPRGVPFFCRPE